ncbi:MULTISPECIES: hypothetical protein [unclassified Kribbella]|uniref:hypothetical protein n=1 Tax=unclassified Kribbella TaxID=2644121 RepID=UPI003793C08A|nr:hypothetical protein OG817_30365 [Kribbella sp. NBC_00889]
MSRSRLAVLLLAPLAVLPAACGGDDTGGLPTVTDSSAPTSATPGTPSATMSASPAPTTQPTRAAAKYGNLTVDLRRPSGLPAAASAAVVTFQQLHVAFGALAAGAKPPQPMSGVAEPVVVKYLDAVLKPQLGRKERSGGTMTVRVTKAQAVGEVAAVNGCLDQSKLITYRANGTKYVDASIRRNPTLTIQATLSRSTGVWRVTNYALKEARC